MCRPALLVAGLLFTAACTNTAHTEPGDKSVPLTNPSALGTGSRIAQLNAPDSGVINAQMVNVTGSTFLWRDTYAETGGASSIGSVYVQDFASDSSQTPPYSGMLMFESVFQPPSLELAPGDVIDFTGEYDDYAGPSSFPFPVGQTEPEMNKPIVTFRFDYTPPLPTVIPVADIATTATQAGFEAGYKWISMLVTVENVVVPLPETPNKGRIAIFITPDTSLEAVAFDNELMAIDYTRFTTGTKLKSVTGIVTYFDSFHIAPRTPDDIVFDTSPTDGGTDAGADAQ